MTAKLTAPRPRAASSSPRKQIRQSALPLNGCYHWLSTPFGVRKAPWTVNYFLQNRVKKQHTNHRVERNPSWPQILARSKISQGKQRQHSLTTAKQQNSSASEGGNRDLHVTHAGERWAQRRKGRRRQESGLDTRGTAPCRGKEDSRVWSRSLGQADVIS